MDDVSVSRTGSQTIGADGGPAADASVRPAFRPALFARYGDLQKLRYDYPLVLVEDEGGAPFLQSLSAVIDGIGREIAIPGAEGEPLRRQLLRLEEAIRLRVCHGDEGKLSGLWKQAAADLLKESGEPAFGPLATNLDRARETLRVDGAVVDCDGNTPTRVLTHVWAAVERTRAKTFRRKIDRLILKLSNILEADFIRSEEARTPEALRSSVGSSFAPAFDFESMSRVLSRGPTGDRLPENRRRRIQAVREVLKTQRFYGPGRASERRPGLPEPYGFVFDNCAAALDAFRDRLPKMVELVEAIAIAELEIENRYREALHDAFFDGFDESALSADQLRPFPSYLVCLRDGRSDPAETMQALEALTSGLQIKVLVQTDDILGGPSPAPPDAFFSGCRARLAAMALGVNDAYVFQTSSATLLRSWERLAAGMTYEGSALFNVFSGATHSVQGVPPYLVAAAATESRAFPTFAYDPAAGGDWATRFDVADNPQATADWPTHGLSYEDEALQRVTEEVPFTYVDFAVCDARFERYYQRIPRAQWQDDVIPLGAYLELPPETRAGRRAYVFTVDSDGALYRTLVDDKLAGVARRCNDAWRRLQELGGIHNSHAKRLLAHERAAWEEEKARELAESAAKATAQQPAPVAGAAPASASVEAKAPAPSEPTEAAESEPGWSGDPWIETSRCTTCNECTQINNKMFVYDENMQAYIADPDAGTYRQLVEAAESCQVSIIHPGRPRNLDEPNLDDLIARAEPFD